MELRDIITELACGHFIRTVDLGGYDGHEYHLVPEKPASRVMGRQIQQMIRDGWLESFNGGYRLTDDGRKAYMRSADELGDGVLRPPSREDSRE